MEHYYVGRNKENPSEYNHIHRQACDCIPDVTNRIYLGYFASYADALKEAEKYYQNRITACQTCCSEYHDGEK